ncbi:hypothetical protein BDV95DRAFT_273956 [Massariosphaeria phaeospora]|uniref:Uncharacterized protein n=1 Tax=Massariosphaeria phaeospora TaxID=100035 RepID=A0A7C8IIY8_9PLEO|nr:hypothetical protein BDV95DRAFT_273956 [Massariosphaeria phaeospora]
MSSPLIFKDVAGPSTFCRVPIPPYLCTPQLGCAYRLTAIIAGCGLKDRSSSGSLGCDIECQYVMGASHFLPPNHHDHPHLNFSLSTPSHISSHPHLPLHITTPRSLAIPSHTRSLNQSPISLPSTTFKSRLSPTRILPPPSPLSPPSSQTPIYQVPAPPAQLNSPLKTLP